MPTALLISTMTRSPVMPPPAVPKMLLTDSIFSRSPKLSVRAVALPCKGASQRV